MINPVAVGQGIGKTTIETLILESTSKFKPNTPRGCVIFISLQPYFNIYNRMKLKSLLSFVLTLLVLSSFAQSPKSQRLVLLEEFTQASCGPCAGQNPWIHNLLTSNPEKITSINYHVSWPGYDPMYLHNTEDPSARVSYYGVSAVPHSVIDGNYFSGYPTGWSINTVNARYAMPSPCEIEIQHELNTAQDTINFTMLIKATTSFSGSPLVGHLAVIEKHIHYNSPPGSNGEKDFYNVLKKLLPSKDGTTLPAMEAGDYYVIQGSWKLANVFTASELAAVGFVQNNQTKEIYQACNSSEQSVTPLYTNDASVLSVANLSPENCFGIVEPVIVIRNNGLNSLSQTTIKYSVNNADPVVYPYSGNLGLFQTTTLALPAYNFDVEENNVLKIWSESPNGVADEYPKNDTVTVVIPQGYRGVPNIVVQVKTDKSPEEFTWEIRDEAGNVVEEGGPYPQQNTVYKDTVEIPINTCYTFHALDAGGNGLCCDNGIGFVKLYDASGANFFVANKFGSEVSTQFWVDSYIGIDPVTALRDKISVYPNPASESLFVSLNLKKDADVELSITDLSGKKVYETGFGHLSTGDHDLTLETSGLTSGLYMVRISTGREVVVRRIMISNN